MLRAVASGLALIAAAAVAESPPAAAPASSAVAAAESAGGWVHAYAAFGEPKYSAGFDHFDYADPKAVKGGTLYLSNPDLRSSFDKFNTYTIKGQAPGGIAIFMTETLAIPSGDEPGTIYGLVAETMRVAPDRSSIASEVLSGGGGIRTHGALARPTVFKTVPFDRSGTPPDGSVGSQQTPATLRRIRTRRGPSVCVPWPTA